MTDPKLRTFLSLYETMNYRRTAELLNLTQPAVTQHIHALEADYGCKLFLYDRHKLSRTPQADLLQKYACAQRASEQRLREELGVLPPRPLRIGATKTIGEFVIADYVASALKNPRGTLTLTVDNTATLLRMLDEDNLDFALVEGTFDKKRYSSVLFRREPFVGICAPEHPFAGKEISLEDAFSETLLLREPGSGTRAIFTDLLRESGHTPESFARTVVVSSFAVIRSLTARGAGISFLYRAAADGMAVFTLHGMKAEREFNIVFLPGTDAGERAEKFLTEGILS